MDPGVLALNEVVNQGGLDPNLVDGVFYGTHMPAEYAIDPNLPARRITPLAEFVSLIIGRVSRSSMTALSQRIGPSSREMAGS